jgi:hypothetical protein
MLFVTSNSQAYLIPAVAAEAATGTGFYYNKAKVENKLKLITAYKITPTSTDIGE